MKDKIETFEDWLADNENNYKDGQNMGKKKYSQSNNVEKYGGI